MQLIKHKITETKVLFIITNTSICNLIEEQVYFERYDDPPYFVPDQHMQIYS